MHSPSTHQHRWTCKTTQFKLKTNSTYLPGKRHLRYASVAAAQRARYPGGGHRSALGLHHGHSVLGVACEARSFNINNISNKHQQDTKRQVYKNKYFEWKMFTNVTKKLQQLTTRCLAYYTANSSGGGSNIRRSIFSGRGVHIEVRGQVVRW